MSGYQIDTIMMHRVVCKGCGTTITFADVDDAHTWMSAHHCTLVAA